MPSIAIFDWSLYTTSLTTSELETSTHGNDPAQTGSNPYNPGIATWTGVDFTYNGGASVLLEINDDDGFFEDGYVETGGAQTLAQDVTINGVDFFAGDVVENEFSLIDSSGLEVWVVRIAGVNVGFSYPQGVPPTATDVFNANDTRDGAPLDSLDQTTGSDEPYVDILCFASGTGIATAKGRVAVEDIEVGDLVWTLDHGLQPVRWRRRTGYGWSCLPDRQKPILFPAGSLGAGLPLRDLIVSPQHRMLVPDETDDRGALCPAKGMTGLSRVRQMHGLRRIELVHILFDRHEIVLAEGTPTESFFPGRVATAGFTAAERRVVEEIVNRAPGALNGLYRPARRFLKVKDAQDTITSRGMCWSEGSLAASGLGAALGIGLSAAG